MIREYLFFWVMFVFCSCFSFWVYSFFIVFCLMYCFFMEMSCFLYLDLGFSFFLIGSWVFFFFVIFVFSFSVLILGDVVNLFVIWYLVLSGDVGLDFCSYVDSKCLGFYSFYSNFGMR